MVVYATTATTPSSKTTHAARVALCSWMASQRTASINASASTRGATSRKHFPPSARQAIIAQIWKDIMKGDSASQEAGRILSKDGIAAILDENQYGLRANPLAGHLHKNLETRHVYHSI